MEPYRALVTIAILQLTKPAQRDRDRILKFLEDLGRDPGWRGDYEERDEMGRPRVMRYYIRHDKQARVAGPFTVEALADSIRAGRISSNALASSDLGDDVADLQVWRSRDWFPLGVIPELRDIVPPMPEAPAKPRRISIFALFLYFTVALTFSYKAITDPGWLVCVFAVLMAYTAVHATIRYVRQRENQTESLSLATKNGT